MSRRLIFRLIALILALSVALPPLSVMAWNIPGHMLSGSIAYQVLRTESPATIATAKSILVNHPWYESRWKEQLDKLPESQRDEMLFMLAPRWADEIRRGSDRAQHRGQWHYINYPFKPDRQPATVQTQPAEAVNILTALAENERIAKTEADPIRRAIALTWLFHLVGDIHQPLHSAQIFTSEYPNGDRGGNLVCVRASDKNRAVDIHRFWDGLITSSNNVGQLRNAATALRNRPEFSKNQLTELSGGDFESWAMESFQIAKATTYQNGAVLGTPRGDRSDCREITDAKMLPTGYAQVAGRIADRRIMLAGHRLARLLTRLSKD